MVEREFLVPTYYKDFVCKGGNCRTCCCGGWAVTVSLKEYFSLLGLECSPQLRYKIDGALHLLKDADEERYAQILPSYDGTCPMRRKEDGYCALQCECGEDSLPAVCRYYPRSPRLVPSPECCISNSCEKVIEDLLASNEKLTFENKKLSFYFDVQEDAVAPENYFSLRKECIDLLQNRSKPLERRLDDITLRLGGRTRDSFSAQKTDECLSDLLSFYTRSQSIGEECEKALAKGRSAAENVKVVNEKFPLAEIWAEKVLSNHFFFMKFPFSERNESLEDVSLGLAGLCLLWTALLAGSEITTKDDFVDLTGKLFRVAEHTKFYKNAAIIMEETLNKQS